MGQLLFNMVSAWPGRVDAPLDIGRRFFTTLDALSRISPAFDDWGSTDDGKSFYPALSRRANAGQWVADHVRLDDFKEPEPERGYWVHAFTDLAQSGSRHRQACFQTQAGSESSNWTVFDIGSEFRPPDLSFVTFDLYKAILLAVVAIWPTYWARVSCSIWGERPPTLPGEPPFPYSAFQMPWIAYLSPEAAMGVTPPSQVESETTPDGGLLMVATRERFDPTNREHMRPSRLMAQILISRQAGLGR